MFGSPIRGVVIGLVVPFLAVSLAKSATAEAVGSALRLRQKTPRSGIGASLNGRVFHGPALRLHNHAAARPLGVELTDAKGSHDDPSYIHSTACALAPVDSLAKQAGDARPPALSGEPGTRHDAGADDPADARPGGWSAAGLANVIATVPDRQPTAALSPLLSIVEGDPHAFIRSAGA